MGFPEIKNGDRSAAAVKDGLLAVECDRSGDQSGPDGQTRPRQIRSIQSLGCRRVAGARRPKRRNHIALLHLRSDEVPVDQIPERLEYFGRALR